jgi:hypothetical protein
MRIPLPQAAIVSLRRKVHKGVGMNLTIPLANELHYRAEKTGSKDSPEGSKVYLNGAGHWQAAEPVRGLPIATEGCT